MIYLLVWIMFVHFLADFVFQTDWMAKNKSKHIGILCVHILEYWAILNLLTAIPFALIPNYVNYALHSQLATNLDAKLVLFVGINSLLHLVIDFFSSKLTSYFWEKKQAHNFFVIVGFDQFLHISILIITAFKFLC